jgi:hypothetical protein
VARPATLKKENQLNKLCSVARPIWRGIEVEPHWKLGVRYAEPPAHLLLRGEFPVVRLRPQAGYRVIPRGRRASIRTIAKRRSQSNTSIAWLIRLFGPSGDVVEVVGIHIDMTERKQTEEARLEAQYTLANANRVATIGQLTARLHMRSISPLAHSSRTLMPLSDR